MKIILAFLCSLCVLCGSSLSAAERKPNIIIFLADDLGYADIGVNGCKDIPTPNIDSIAKNGVRFTDGYATHCVCSPSRAGLMSGMYQHRFGFEANSGPERYADPNFGMPREIPSLAEKLKGAGYATGMIGKWHIGFKEGLRPHERGFDYHYGFLSGAHTYTPGKRDSDAILRNGQPVQPTKYLTDEFADEAVGFVERSKDKPFFLYFAFNAVHSPLDENKYAERFPALTGNRKTYAGMLSALDDAVGRVLAKVRDLGQEENTLVMFYSDNGGPTQQTTSRNDPLRGYKAQFFEGGVRVPFIVRWPGKIPANRVNDEPVTIMDMLPTFVSLAGGAVPQDRVIDGKDVWPVLAGFNGAKSPHDSIYYLRGNSVDGIRSGDWKLLLVDAKQTPSDAEGELTEEQKNLPPRQLKKLRKEEAKAAKGKKGEVEMLFNLRDDLGEKKDLSKEHPDIVARLKKQLMAFRTDLRANKRPPGVAE